MTAAFIVKVTGMLDKASTGVVRLKELCSALYLLKERTVRSVLLIGRVRIQPPMVRIQLPRVRIIE